MENQELYLTELLAFCVRKGKALLITALVFALGFAAWQLYQQLEAARDPQYSEKKIEERYQAAIEAYDKKVEDTNKSIENNEKAKADKEEYLEKSILMHIDPYDEYITEIYFGFSVCSFTWC